MSDAQVRRDDRSEVHASQEALAIEQLPHPLDVLVPGDALGLDPADRALDEGADLIAQPLDLLLGTESPADARSRSFQAVTSHAS